jgi:group II intron reverse transcriptase/maturase
MLAVKRVTQLNKGKNTAGVDGKKVLTPRARIKLVEKLKQEWAKWDHQELRPVEIPKSNGKTRTLKIPTIADRAWQALLKSAIEPAHEATFHARSYGFRPGRGTHDAQEYVFLNLKGNSRRKSGPATNKKVIELDIEKCFDTISHKAILDRLIAPQCVKSGLLKCLRAGTVDIKYPKNSNEVTIEGTPQGGVISPLLANVALNGIEEICPSVRYADDMVFFIKDEDGLNRPQLILRRVESFLAERGMRMSQEKTRVTDPKEGFDFLGWNFRVQSNGKCKSSPSKKNQEKFIEKMDSLRLDMKLSAEELVSKVAPIVRGWCNYHKYTDGSSVKRTMWFVNHALFKRFNKGKKTTYEEAVRMAKEACPTVETKTNGFVMVKGNKSVYDGDITYWSKRNNSMYEGLKAQIIMKQRYVCNECGLKLLMSDDNAEIHHVDRNHANNRLDNLVALHRSCHMKLKMST